MAAFYSVLLTYLFVSPIVCSAGWVGRKKKRIQTISWLNLEPKWQDGETFNPDDMHLHTAILTTDGAIPVLRGATIRSRCVSRRPHNSTHWGGNGSDGLRDQRRA